MLKQFKKFKRLILLSTLKPKAFLILFVLFFSSLAFAATLSVTWLDGRIPSHNSDFCKNSAGEYTLNKDTTEDPYDVVFSTDGLQVFSANFKQEQSHSKGNLSMNRLVTAFDVPSNKRQVFGDVDCDFIDDFRIRTLSGNEAGAKLRGITVADNGNKFFFNHEDGRITRFDLSIQNEFSSNTYIGSILLKGKDKISGMAISNDGTKIYTIDHTVDTPLLTTFQLPSPYDISSATQIHEVDLSDIGVPLPEDGDNKGRDIEFSTNGNAMFVMISNDDTDGVSQEDSFIYQFTLSSNFDVSTASLIGSYNINNFGNASNGLGKPRGFVFSSDGMRMFITDIKDGGVEWIKLIHIN